MRNKFGRSQAVCNNQVWLYHCCKNLKTHLTVHLILSKAQYFNKNLQNVFISRKMVVMIFLNYNFVNHKVFAKCGWCAKTMTLKKVALWLKRSIVNLSNMSDVTYLFHLYLAALFMMKSVCTIAIMGQYHQHFTSNLYMIRSQKRKNDS